MAWGGMRFIGEMVAEGLPAHTCYPERDYCELFARLVIVSQRHHYIPEFYLRGFANAKGKLRVYRAGSTLPSFTTSVKNAAVEGGFYELPSNDPSESGELEDQLSAIESKAAITLRRTLLRGFPPVGAARSEFSVFLGLQMMRTPAQRVSFEMTFDRIEKVLYEGITQENARSRLVKIGMEPSQENIDLLVDIGQNPTKYRFVPKPGEFLLNMVKAAVASAEAIADRSWHVGISPGPGFLAGDHSLLRYSTPTSPPRLTGLGLHDAESIYFTLDRYHVLRLGLHDAPENSLVLKREEVDFINSLLIRYSFHYVFQHPDDTRIDARIPKEPRALFKMNQKDIFEEDDRDLIHLDPILSPHAIHGPEEPLPTTRTVFSADEILHLAAADPRDL